MDALVGAARRYGRDAGVPGWECDLLLDIRHSAREQ